LPENRDLLTEPPDFHLVKAAKDAQSDGTKDLLKEAKKLLLAYAAGNSPESFLTLLDWAYLSVHNGDLDSRDNPGLWAIYDWTRTSVAFPGLQRWIEAEHDTDLLRRMGWDPSVPPTAQSSTAATERPDPDESKEMEPTSGPWSGQRGSTGWNGVDAVSINVRPPPVSTCKTVDSSVDSPRGKLTMVSSRGSGTPVIVRPTGGEPA